MLGKEFFYNHSIRDLVAVFGKLFTDIKIEQKQSDGGTKPVTVPIHFANQSKLYQRIFNKEDGPISLPRMGFDFMVQGVDPERKTSRLNQQMWTSNKETGQNSWSYNAVPYNFDFNLTIFTNDIEDGLQIVEQILPNFQPSLTVKIKPFEGEDEVVDITIVLESVANEFETEGPLLDRDYYTWNMNFTIKGWLWTPRTDDSNIILDVSGVNVFDWQELNQ